MNEIKLKEPLYGTLYFINILLILEITFVPGSSYFSKFENTSVLRMSKYFQVQLYAFETRLSTLVYKQKVSN